MLKLDKEKYFAIVRSQGLNAAITALHKDKEALELKTFEGPEGYQRELWDSLTEYRDFSRELWNMILEDKYAKNGN